MDCSTPGSPVLHYLPEFAQTHTESVMASSHNILCHPLFPLPSIFPSIRFFPSKLALHIRRPKYWSFSFSISPFSEYSWLISFRIHLILCCCSHLLIWFANFLSGVAVPYIYRENLNHLGIFFFFSDYGCLGPTTHRLNQHLQTYCDLPKALRRDPDTLSYTDTSCSVANSAWERGSVFARRLTESSPLHKTFKRENRWWFTCYLSKYFSVAIFFT